jgi:hypothetical protein
VRSISPSLGSTLRSRRGRRGLVHGPGDGIRRHREPCRRLMVTRPGTRHHLSDGVTAASAPQPSIRPPPDSRPSRSSVQGVWPGRGPRRYSRRRSGRARVRREPGTTSRRTHRLGGKVRASLSAAVASSICSGPVQQRTTELKEQVPLLPQIILQGRDGRLPLVDAGQDPIVRRGGWTNRRWRPVQGITPAVQGSPRLAAAAFLPVTSAPRSRRTRPGSRRDRRLSVKRWLGGSGHRWGGPGGGWRRSKGWPRGPSRRFGSLGKRYG